MWWMRFESYASLKLN
uniref:Uncharacterized protein n=1 Tax=Arundo donax TaxID=35708 RepID=A0A0A8ZSA0_ARUDO